MAKVIHLFCKIWKISIYYKLGLSCAKLWTSYSKVGWIKIPFHFSIFYLFIYTGKKQLVPAFTIVNIDFCLLLSLFSLSLPSYCYSPTSGIPRKLILYGPSYFYIISFSEPKRFSVSMLSYPAFKFCKENLKYKENMQS